MEFFLNQASGLLGAVMVLSAYFLLQTSIVNNTSYPFLILNLLGGALLFIASAVTGQLGLILLEGTWTAISFYALMKKIKQKSAAGI